MVWGVLALSLVYLGWAAFHHASGERGVLRGAILFLCASLFLVGKRLEPSRTALLLKRGVIGVLGAGVLDLLLHNPGAGVLGIEPRYPDDFLINLTAARELYGFDRLPYGIQQAFNLPNASISFPFPTYWIYWFASGFGHLDDLLSGCLFTAINLIATMLLICRSFRLAGMRVAQAEMFWILLFLSPVWGTILIGQTPTLAAACIVVGWLHLRSDSKGSLLLGVVLVSLGLLIKPNFAPVLFGLFLERGNSSNPRKPLLVFGLIGASLGVILAGTLLVPGGVTLETYQAFREIALPKVLSKVGAPNNLSLIGSLVRNLSLPVKPGFLAGGLGTLLVGFGLWKKKDWRYWFLVPLVVSPITWSPYLALALPVQFALVGSCDRMWNCAVVLSAGLIALSRYETGTVGLLILFFLVLVNDQDPVPGKN